MIEVSSALNDVKFDDVKDCGAAKEIWEKIILIHGGDQNVLRDKEESLGKI